MGVEPPPGREPRAPRPDDPFARPAAAPVRPRPRKRKKGRTFFLFLLMTGGALALASLILFFSGRDMIVGFYEDVVVPRGIPEALPPGYPREDAERLVRGLHDFFTRADDGGIGDDDVLRVISAIEAAMADDRVTPEEAGQLLDLTHSLDPPGSG